LCQLISAAREILPNVTIIVTCRKKNEHLTTSKKKGEEGGREIAKTQKMDMLKEAVLSGTDFIDIELAEGKAAIRELKSFCKKNGGKSKIIISYHDVGETPALTKLKEIFRQCAAEKPAIVKIVTYARSFEDNLRVLSLITYANKHSQKIIAFCMGNKGRISRIAAPSLGSFLSFATLEPQGRSAPGQLTINEMKLINKLLKNENSSRAVNITPADPPQNYILLGNPVKQSLSPLMHNAALKEMGIKESYSAFCVHDLSDALQGMRGMNIRGASVTIPFKVAVMEHLDDIYNDALQIGAVNTIINENGRLIGHNTDWLGLIQTLKDVMTISGKTFVIIGAGGTAQAAVYGIIKEGGSPVIINRTAEKGKFLSARFGCLFYPPSEIARIKADCLINTTPVGMYPRENESPVPAAALKGYEYVMDVIYNPLETKLLRDAHEQGCRTLSGLDMFVYQGARQILLWKGKEPPRELMQKVVLEELINSE
jgi:shikimate dehydrogenase/3-dehydroquinate dehydratase type I